MEWLPDAWPILALVSPQSSPVVNQLLKIYHFLEITNISDSPILCIDRDSASFSYYADM